MKNIKPHLLRVGKISIGMFSFLIQRSTSVDIRRRAITFTGKTEKERRAIE